jgi:RimJ/RimL family protein N-acetyltransferase
MSESTSTIPASPLPFVTERCLLRAFREDDLPAFAAYRADPEVARYQSWSTYSMEDALAFFEAQSQVEWGAEGSWYQVAVADRATDRLLGDCALHFLGGAQVELGFTLAREHQGRGIMREAVTALLDRVFGEVGIHRVVAVTDARNTASARLLSRLGFRKEGHFLQNVLFKGAWGRRILVRLPRGGVEEAAAMSGATSRGRAMWKQRP